MVTPKVLLVNLLVVVAVFTYDCYDQRCYGVALGNSTRKQQETAGNSSNPQTEDYSKVYVSCDQSTNHCDSNSTGYPLCVAGAPGNGTFCSEQLTVCLSYHGRAVCIEGVERKKINLTVICVPLTVVLAAVLLFIVVSCKKRQKADQADDLAPVIDNIQLEHAEPSTSGLGNVPIEQNTTTDIEKAPIE